MVHPAVHTRHQTVRAPCLSKHLDTVGHDDAGEHLVIGSKRRRPAITIIATVEPRRRQPSTAICSPSLGRESEPPGRLPLARPSDADGGGDAGERLRHECQTRRWRSYVTECR
jgi:hypothetical protein